MGTCRKQRDQRKENWIVCTEELVQSLPVPDMAYRNSHSTARRERRPRADESPRDLTFRM